MPLFTIGYEGSTVDDFLAVLTEVGVRHLVDVRDLPSSRKAGFSKNSLRDRLVSTGIQYSHVKVLGDPREGRLAARAGDKNRFERIFREHISNLEASAAIRSLANEDSQNSICLMCFERDHKFCHRQILCEEILSLSAMPVRHLGVPKDYALKAA
ncbi:DUF488 domain-containing protein [Mesorhizobium liriopis]|uniref:DUF488 domain-containing protein n=1 Tax=Mesorhizobium liriopis TaxID=2953882 RepID=UPI00338EC781